MPLSSRDYFRALGAALDGIAPDALDAAIAQLDAAYARDGTIFVVGNGQSATTASAFALDLTKQTFPPPGVRPFRLVALTDNVAALTAWGNDVGYDAVFREQLRSLWRPGDLLLAISASGNSPNVLRAGEWVREQGGALVGLAGFGGGALQALADACVVVPSDDYGLVETAHLAILHFWVDWFRARLAG